MLVEVVVVKLEVEFLRLLLGLITMVQHHLVVEILELLLGRLLGKEVLLLIFFRLLELGDLLHHVTSIQLFSDGAFWLRKVDKAG